MHLTTPREMPKQWDDGSPMDFLNWKTGAPYGREDKTCVFIRGNQNSSDEFIGYWENGVCEEDGQQKLPICERDALPGPINPDNEPLPTVPSNEFCTAGWHYLSQTQKCYKLSDSLQTWKISADYCAKAGAGLASINSPDEQNGVFSYFTLHDPTALGGLLKKLSNPNQ